MRIAFSGIEPTVVVDTSTLQNETEVIKQVRVAGPKPESSRSSVDAVFDVSTPGVCLSMVCDWFQKCAKLHDVSEISQLKTSLGYSLAQTAYMRYAFGSNTATGRGQTSREGRFIKSHGLAINENLNPNKRTVDFYNPRDQRGGVGAQEIATRLSRTWSNYIIIIGGLAGGHALGYNASLNQFLDPNIGILKFTSQDDFAVWLAAFLPANYPGLMNSGWELIKLQRSED